MRFRKNTDINKVKSTALSFLYLDIKNTEFSPFFVEHPFFQSAYINVKRQGNFITANILEDTLAKKEVISQYSRRITNCNNVYDIVELILTKYRLTFFSYIFTYLNKYDYSKLLGDIWVFSENPNQDANVPTKKAIKWFQMADKQYLMNEDEYGYYNDLSQTITVYRGVAVQRNPHGLSWTCNENKAHWFANRFNTETKQGYVQKAIINKSDVLAYFNRRNEDEIIVNTTNISIL